jgi:hypothetical protein
VRNIDTKGRPAFSTKELSSQPQRSVSYNRNVSQLAVSGVEVGDTSIVEGEDSYTPGQRDDTAPINPSINLSGKHSYP